MKRFFLFLLPVCVALVSCKSGPAKVNADLASLRAGAELGSANSQCELGMYYMRLLNFTEASKWFRKAADQGSREAQYRLAVNCEKGDGEPKDAVEAYAWFSVASERGHRLALNGREHLTHLLSRNEIEEGNRKAFAYATRMPMRENKSEIPQVSTPTESSKPEAVKKQVLTSPKSK